LWLRRLPGRFAGEMLWQPYLHAWGLRVGTDAGSWRFKHDRNPTAGSKIYFPKWRAVCAARGIRGRIFFLHLKKKRLQLPSKKRSAGQPLSNGLFPAIRHSAYIIHCEPHRLILNFFFGILRFGGLPAPITIPLLEEQIEARWKRKSPVNPIAFPALETL
jgi:hypothetical protein